MRRRKLYLETDRFEIMLHHSPPTLYAEETHETVQVCIPFEGACYDVLRPAAGGRMMTHTLASSDILVVPRNQPHSVNWKHSADILSLQFSNQMLEEVLGQPAPEIRDTTILRDRFLGQVALQLREAVLAGEPSSILLSSLATVIAYRVGRNADAAGRFNDFSAHPLDKRTLVKLEAFIDAHLDQPIRLHQLAALAGQSQWHFLRRFQVATGMAPNAFVQKRRIDCAAALIAGSDLDIIEIAFRVGMSPSYLSRVFVRLFGMPPTAYRRSVRR